MTLREGVPTHGDGAEGPLVVDHQLPRLADEAFSPFDQRRGSAVARHHRHEGSGLSDAQGCDRATRRGRRPGGGRSRKSVTVPASTSASRTKPTLVPQGPGATPFARQPLLFGTCRNRPTSTASYNREVRHATMTRVE